MNQRAGAHPVQRRLQLGGEALQLQEQALLLHVRKVLGPRESIQQVAPKIPPAA